MSDLTNLTPDFWAIGAIFGKGVAIIAVVLFVGLICRILASPTGGKQ